MHSIAELRKTKRYQVSALASFVWAPFDGKAQCGQGLTRDINALGVYVTTDVLPPVGARIQIEITLPKLMDTGSGMHLQGEGVVLRCEYSAAKQGFAASAQLYPESAEAVLSQFKASGRAQ